MSFSIVRHAVVLAVVALLPLVSARASATELSAGKIIVAQARTRPAAAEIVTPPPGSALRRTILDALRPTMEAEIGGSIEFVVSVIRASPEWAFVQGRLQRPGGAAIDWRRTKFREAFETDSMSDIVMGLLRRSGSQWTVAEYAIGPTDVAWDEWRERLGLPPELFGQ